MFEGFDWFRKGFELCEGEPGLCEWNQLRPCGLQEADGLLTTVWKQAALAP